MEFPAQQLHWGFQCLGARAPAPSGFFYALNQSRLHPRGGRRRGWHPIFQVDQPGSGNGLGHGDEFCSAHGTAGAGLPEYCVHARHGAADERPDGGKYLPDDAATGPEHRPEHLQQPHHALKMELPVHQGVLLAHDWPICDHHLQSRVYHAANHEELQRRRALHLPAESRNRHLCGL